MQRSYGFFVNQRLPCPLLASLGNWKEGGARLPRDLERLEERVYLIPSLQLMGLLGPTAI